MLLLLHSQDGGVDIRFPKREVLDGGVNVPMYKGLLRPEDVATQPLINTVGDKNISKPETVDEAVDRLVSEMNLKALNQVARMSEDDLIELHFTAGMWIRQLVYPRNDKLLQSCREVSGDMSLHWAQMHMVIIRPLWKRLQETHKLKVVK